MPGRDGEWCDPHHPCNGPVDVCPFDNADGAFFFIVPSSPPAPCFMCHLEPEGAAAGHNPMDKFRQVGTAGIVRNMEDIVGALMYIPKCTHLQKLFTPSGPGGLTWWLIRGAGATPAWPSSPRWHRC